MGQVDSSYSLGTEDCTPTTYIKRHDRDFDAEVFMDQRLCSYNLTALYKSIIIFLTLGKYNPEGVQKLNEKREKWVRSSIRAVNGRQAVM